LQAFAKQSEELLGLAIKKIVASSSRDTPRTINGMLACLVTHFVCFHIELGNQKDSKRKKNADLKSLAIKIRDRLSLKTN